MLIAEWIFSTYPAECQEKKSNSCGDYIKSEKTKIECARKFFEEINRKYTPENVKYEVVNSFGKLMGLVK